MAKVQRAANRQFYSIPSPQQPDTNQNDHEQVPSETQANSLSQDSSNTSLSQGNSLLKYISKSVIGTDKTFSGPFGLRKVTYLDYVASGRALHFIENYIQSEVLPEYGNTHTTTSVTSLQTTLFRHEARDILRNSFNASEHDSVIFTGSGCTGAVHKFIHALNVEKNPMVVLVGPYEHHSNILPWKESGAEVIRIKQTATGHVNMQQLEQTLKAHQGCPKQVIGAFSAASNVTGVLSEVDAITICLHKHGALAVWDFACAAPYVKLDMNPYIGGPDQPYVYKDAVVMSVHKFVGGTSTPGVLIAKKKLFRNPVPEGCGGGTVFFVRRENHRYLQEPESKEEGGTPGIVQSIRAGLVVQLKQAVGVDNIVHRDQALLRQAQAAWSDCPELVFLGPPAGPDAPDKLPIFSFLVLHHGTGRFLHHNFVASVLNDVFGIQARGGCACAGPYAMDLLGLTEKTAEAIEELIAEDSRLDRTHLRRMREYSHREILRPGFVRLNLPYFLDEDCVQFVLEAVKMTARHAWKLLPQYLFNPETAEWRQRYFQTFKDRKWLGHISYQTGEMKYHQPRQVVKGPLPTSYQDCLQKAEKLFEDAHKFRLKVPDQTALFDEAARPYRWFVLPSEASACLLAKQKSSSSTAAPLPTPVAPDDLPFFPGRHVQGQSRTGRCGDSVSEAVEAVSGVDEGGMLKQTEENNESPNYRNKEAVEGNKTNDTYEEASGGDHSNTGDGVATDTVGEKGGLVALRDALSYADNILKAMGPNPAADEVSSVMRNIWQSFDPQSSLSEGNVGARPPPTRSAIDEVTSTMNQIWDSFSVSQAGVKDNKSFFEKPKVNSFEGKEKKIVAANSLNEVNNGLRQIWDGFAPGEVKVNQDSESQAGVSKKENSIESCMRSLPQKNIPHATSSCSSQNPVVNGALDEISNAMNGIWKSFAGQGEKDSGIKEPNARLPTDESGQQNKCNEPQASSQVVQPHSSGSCVLESLNADFFRHVADLNSNNTSTAAAIESIKDMNGTGNHDTPMREHTSQAQINESKEDSKEQSKAKDHSSAAEEVRNVMNEIWEYFTPRKQKDSDIGGTGHAENKKNEISSQISSKVGAQALAEVTNGLNKIWDSFTPERMTDSSELPVIQNGETTWKERKSFPVESAPAQNSCASKASEDRANSDHGLSFSEGMIKALSQGFGEDVDGNDGTCGKAEEEKELQSMKFCNLKDSSSSVSTSGPSSQPVMTAESVGQTPVDSATEKNMQVRTAVQESDKQPVSLPAYSGNTPPPSRPDITASSPRPAQTSQAPAPLTTMPQVCPLLRRQKPGVNSPGEDAAAKVQWFAPPKQIFKPAVTALEEYSMLKDGDKVLVCLSGGKDSLSLLHTIRQYQFYARGKGINFDFGAVTVDPMTPAYDPSPLKQYLVSLGVPYFYESQCILETAEQLPYECASICSFCSRMKRGRIYAAARREGYNVLALGQHLDDLTESFLMSFFHNGNLNTMKAHYTIKQGDLRVIRPFVYVREADLRAFAEQRKLPIIAENCPACFEAPKERHRTKQLLAAQEVMFPQVYSSMMAALKPLMARDISSRMAVQGDEDEGE